MYVGSVFLFGTRWYWGLTIEQYFRCHCRQRDRKLRTSKKCGENTIIRLYK